MKTPGAQIGRPQTIARRLKADIGVDSFKDRVLTLEKGQVKRALRPAFPHQAQQTEQTFIIPHLLQGFAADIAPLQPAIGTVTVAFPRNALWSLPLPDSVASARSVPSILNWGSSDTVATASPTSR